MLSVTSGKPLNDQGAVKGPIALFHKVTSSRNALGASDEAFDDLLLAARNLVALAELQQ
jgi:hypothetical protein